MSRRQVGFPGLIIVLSLFLVVVCGATTAAAAGVPKEMAGHFVDAEWLKANLSKVIVLDVRSDKEYKAGHLPGALGVTWQSLSNMQPRQGEAGWGVVLRPEQLAEKLGALGIDGTKPVVVYNDPHGFGEDGRVVWMLHYGGVKDAKMLHGGFPAWEKAKGAVTRDIPEPKGVKFSGTPDESLIATTAYLKANRAKLKLIDARSPEEYLGKTDHGEKKRGHIPGAIHFHFKDAYNDDGYVKSVAELKAAFTKAGLKPEDDIVVYCTVGIRSGFLAELLRMAGFSKAKNYNASMSEWAGDPANPVEK